MQTRLWLRAAVGFLSFFSCARAAVTCSQTQVKANYGLYQSAAASPACAKYAIVSSSGVLAKIDFTCKTTACVPIMQQLAVQLPDCVDPTTGVNYMQELNRYLYTTCKLCKKTDDEEMNALWKSAAQTAACAPYASASSRSFTWPCSATSCTAVLKNLASTAPDCLTGVVSEKNSILNSCTSTNTPATLAPATLAPATLAPATLAPATLAPATLAPATLAPEPVIASPSATTFPSNSGGSSKETSTATSTMAPVPSSSASRMGGGAQGTMQWLWIEASCVVVLAHAWMAL